MAAGRSSKRTTDIDQYVYQFRLILVGDSHVGKSCLLRRFKEGKFIEFNDPTVGVDFHTNMIEIDGCTLKLQLWDTAGHERFRAITRSYYRNAVGVLLVFDITDQNSFSRLPEWIEDILQSSKPHSPVFVLVGNKSDLDKEREILSRDAQQFADERGMDYIETSARTGSNTEKVFSKLAQKIHDAIENGSIPVGEGWDGVKKGNETPKSSSRVDLHKNTSTNSVKKEGRCC